MATEQCRGSHGPAGGAPDAVEEGRGRKAPGTRGCRRGARPVDRGEQPTPPNFLVGRVGIEPTTNGSRERPTSRRRRELASRGPQVTPPLATTKHHPARPHDLIRPLDSRAPRHLPNLLPGERDSPLFVPSRGSAVAVETVRAPPHPGDPHTGRPAQATPPSSVLKLQRRYSNYRMRFVGRRGGSVVADIHAQTQFNVGGAAPRLNPPPTVLVAQDSVGSCRKGTLLDLECR